MRLLTCSLLALSLGSSTACMRGGDFRAVLVDTESKKPVPAARIILCRKQAEKRQCTIDTSLTGLSNDNGEVRLQNMASGQYVVFYNTSGTVRAELKGKVVLYDRVDNDDYVKAIARSLGEPGLLVLKGSSIGIVDGLISVERGYMYASTAQNSNDRLGGKAPDGDHTRQRRCAHEDRNPNRPSQIEVQAARRCDLNGSSR